MKAPPTLGNPHRTDNKASSAEIRTWRYRKLARRAMVRDLHMCQACKAKGLITPAAEIDHIQPRAQRPDLTYELDNMQALCIRCHQAKTKGEAGHMGGG